MTSPSSSELHRPPLSSQAPLSVRRQAAIKHLKERGFEELSCLHESVNSWVFRVRREGRLSILKVLSSAQPTARHYARYRQEFELCQTLSSPYVVRALALHDLEGRPAIEFEDSGARPLSELIQGAALSIERLLSLAIELCSALSYLHHQGVIHRDINPHNLIYHPQSGRVQVIDLGLATRQRRTYVEGRGVVEGAVELSQAEGDQLKREGRLQGTLSYLSPEQTGRLNRPVDLRSDLYALGVTLFELTTQRLPFIAKSVSERVYAHIALSPPKPRSLRADCPPFLNDLILKLLAKSPSERYASAAGVRADLERGLRLLRAGQPMSFPLAQHDMSATLQAPSALVGRERELNALLKSFERARVGRAELTLVAGYSGVGKSSLVRELSAPVARAHGLMISGKFDQLQRGAALGALSGALKQLVSHLLSLPPRALKVCREALGEQLGELSASLCPLAPDLERLVGAWHPLEPAPAAEAQRRLHLAFERLFSVVSSAERPLVLFLDDLQWADPASLRVVESLIMSEGLQHTLIVGAYRDNEVDERHTLSELRHHLERGQRAPELLELEPLTLEHTQALVADCLQGASKVSDELGALVFDKTKGNPFFAFQLLESLYERALLAFNPTLNAWSWQRERAEALNITDNVVELLLSRLERVSEACRGALAMAACAGHTFSLGLLSRALERPLSEVAEALWPALELELITFKERQDLKNLARSLDEADALELYGAFAHDRIQQAALELLSEDARAAHHATLARAMGALPEPELLAMSAQIARALPCVRDLDEASAWLMHLSAAMKRATEATAASVAVELTRAARELLQTHPALLTREEPHDLYALFLRGLKASTLAADYELADEFYERLLTQQTCDIERAEGASARLDQLLVQGRLAEGVERSLEVLASLGVALPSDEDEAGAQQLQRHEQISALLGGREPLELLNEAPNEQALFKHTIDLLYGLFLTSYLSGRGQLALLCFCDMTLLSMRRGPCPLSAYGYVGYGMVLTVTGRDFTLGRAFAELGVALCERFDDLATICRTNFLFAADVRNWTAPILEGQRYYQRAHEVALQSGDWLTVGYVAMQSSSDQLTAGVPLAELERWLTSQLKLLRQRGGDDAIEIITAGVYRPLKHLMNQEGGEEAWATLDGPTFEGEPFEVSAYREKHQDNGFYLAWLSAGELRAGWLRQDVSSYPELIERVKVIEASVPSHAKVPEASAFAALMCVSLLKTELGEHNTPEAHKAREGWQAELERLSERLERWAEVCPENVEARLTWLQAERLWLEAQLEQKTLEQASARFTRALERAQRAEHVALQAMILERYALLLEALDERAEARAHRQRAVTLYETWGALAKSQALLRAHPELTLETRSREQLPSVTTATLDLNTHLDTEAIVGASLSLSRELRFEPLCEQLMRLALTHSGAQRGALITTQARPSELHTDQSAHDELSQAREPLWCVRASAERMEPVRLLSGCPLEGEEAEGLVSQQFVRLTLRSGAMRLSQDALADPTLSLDPYIKATAARALLCLPLKRGEQVIGALYLEHRDSVGAFKAEHVSALHYLSAQVAVSLSNAMLVEALEDSNRALEARVKERTRALSEAQEELKGAYERVNALLLNTLPPKVVARMLKGPQRLADRLPDVSVLFLDIVGFTKMSEQLSPEALVELLNELFTALDQLAARYQLEKIKTIGDAYMLAGGLPDPREGHLEDMARFALEAIELIQRFVPHGSPHHTLNARVGVHVGPVVAGVIGESKLSYDLWGDTVNTASRHESTGLPGRVQVSAEVAARLQGRFELESRGMIELKGKGLREVFLLGQALTTSQRASSQNTASS